MEDRHSLQKLLDFQQGLIKHKEVQAWMEHLAALHASQRRQPPAKGITSSVGARLTDAEGCTSHPVAGEADPDNSDKISIQNFKLLQKTTCCCAFP